MPVCRLKGHAPIVVTLILLTFIGLCGPHGRQDEKGATHIVHRFTSPILRTRFTTPVI